MRSEGDRIAQAIQIGEENHQILRLAEAWCRNISHTKGPLGTGLIEEMTGLPVGGGSLRCDFATAPTIFGMQLKNTAVGFYEENCIGCVDRAATDATEHLGSWADVRIAERGRMDAEAARQHQEALEASRMRAANRRFCSVGLIQLHSRSSTFSTKWTQRQNKEAETTNQARRDGSRRLFGRTCRAHDNGRH